MKTKMIRAVIAAICIAAALPSWAADGRLVSPVYSIGLFDPSSPTSSTPILQTSRLAFKGITLDELKAMVDEGYSLFGCMIGSYVTAKGSLGGFYNLQSYPQSGPIEKIVGSTMDLTVWPSDLGWPMYSRFGGGNTTMSFADGTVNVSLNMSRADMVALAKTKVDGAYAGYLLKWGTEAGTLATRNANAKFALDAESAQKYQLIANGTGLLLRPRCGLMVIVR